MNLYDGNLEGQALCCFLLINQTESPTYTFLSSRGS